MNCAIWYVLTHVYLWKFHHIKDGEHIHHLRKFPCMLCHHSHTFTFPLFPDSHWNHHRKHLNGIMKYIVLVCCCCSSFFHLSLLFWDSSMLVSISVGHSYWRIVSILCISHNLFIYSPLDRLLDCFGLQIKLMNIMYKSSCGHLFPLPLNLWLVIS